MQILQADLHTFFLRISWENLIEDQGIFSLVVILLILVTLFVDKEWTSLGENCCWSPLGLKGLGWLVFVCILLWSVPAGYKD